MFGLGFWETMVILLVIIIFVKPSDLPVFMRKAGQLLGKARAGYDTLKEALHRIESEEKRNILAGIAKPEVKADPALSEPESQAVKKRSKPGGASRKKTKSKKKLKNE